MTRDGFDGANSGPANRVSLETAAAGQFVGQPPGMGGGVPAVRRSISVPIEVIAPGKHCGFVHCAPVPPTKAVVVPVEVVSTSTKLQNDGISHFLPTETRAPIARSRDLAETNGSNIGVRTMPLCDAATKARLSVGSRERVREFAPCKTLPAAEAPPAFHDALAPPAMTTEPAIPQLASDSTHVSRPPGCSEIEVLTQLRRTKRKLRTPDALWKGKDDRVTRLVESIRQVSEAMVWGERNDGALFDLFCEHHMLASFVGALHAQATPNTVKVQLLQTLSILVQNSRRPTSSVYLLSGGQLNTLFDAPPDLNDEEILAYFIALLKGVALRLDDANACLLLSVCKAEAAEGTIPTLGNVVTRLPILERAIALGGHRDSMVRTGARTALLRIAQLAESQIRSVVKVALDKLCVPAVAVWFRAICAGTSDEELEDLRSFVVDLAAARPDLGVALEVELGEELGRLLPMSLDKLDASALNWAGMYADL